MTRTSGWRSVKGTAIRRTIKVKKKKKRNVNTAIFIGVFVRGERVRLIGPVIESCHFHVTAVRWTKLERSPVLPVS